MNYLQTEHLEDYWIATAGLHIFSGMFLKKEVHILISQLIDLQHITVEKTNEIKEMIGWNDIQVLRFAMTSNGECTCLQAEAFLLFLSDYGYFNPTRKNINLVSLNIPNTEIYQYLYKQHLANGDL